MKRDAAVALRRRHGPKWHGLYIVRAAGRRRRGGTVVAHRSVMLHRKRALFGSSVLVAVGVFLAPASAPACSPEACFNQHIRFEGKALPAGVRALPVPDGVTPTLLRAGTVVPAALTGADPLLLVPEAPLAEGAYTLTYTSACNPSGTPVAFSVGPSASKPLATGTLHFGKRFVAGAKAMPSAGGGCGASADSNPNDHVVVDVTFEPAAEIGNYLPLTRFEASVAGAKFRWKTTFTATAATAVTTFTASCGGADPNNFAPGIYSMSVAGRIAGDDGDLPSSTAALDLSCPSAPDASDDGAGGGCTIGGANSGRGTPEFAGLGVGLMLVLVLLLRRRALSRAS
jgi:hypothetical protein